MVCHVDLMAVETTTELSDEGAHLMVAANVIERLLISGGIRNNSTEIR